MTYAILSGTVLAVITAVTVPTLRRLPTVPLALTGVVLMALTAVFDNIIVGIGLVDYDESKTAGLRVPIAPIEDFAYAVGVVLLVPALWTWLGRGGQGSDAS